MEYLCNNINVIHTSRIHNLVHIFLSDFILFTRQLNIFLAAPNQNSFVSLKMSCSSTKIPDVETNIHWLTGNRIFINGGLKPASIKIENGKISEVKEGPLSDKFENVCIYQNLRPNKIRLST